MSGPTRAAIVLALGIVVATLGAWWAGPLDDLDLVARLLAVAGGAVLAAGLLEWLPGRAADGDDPDGFERAWRRATARSRTSAPPEREHLHRLVRLATTSAGDAHRRLRPLLRDLADARYDAAHGTHPDRDPRAAERLGAAWAWVRPDRPEPADRFDPGPDLDELDGVVAALEALAPGRDDIRDGQPGGAAR